MIFITCVDDKMGMLFNRRRQSMDSAVRARILERCGGQKLWMNAYSYKQFNSAAGIMVDEAFMQKAAAGDCCFAENIAPGAYADKIEKIVLYKWNRVYPADLYFDLDLANWRLVESTDFAGTSHDKITEEVYVK